MSVALNPSNTLGFPRPLTTHVKRTLSITNNNAQPVAFKVKTTAPKLYCVRPNSGRVEPGETAEVSVMLQAMKEEPPLGAKCKDKFLIQSTLITPEKETLPLQDIWSGEPNEEIHSQKIKVAYLPPEGQTVPEEDEHVQPSLFEPAADPSGIHGYETAPRGQNGYGAPPIPEFHDDNMQEHPSDRDIHVSAPSTPPPEVSREPSRRTHESPVEESPVANEAPAVINVNVHHPSPPPPPPQPIPDPTAALQAKLNEANAEILRLRSLISSMPDLSTVQSATATSQAIPTELRRRTRALSDDGSTLGPETEVGSYVEEGMMQPEGVPLQIVIVVALGVFITTYLFF